MNQQTDMTTGQCFPPFSRLVEHVFRRSIIVARVVWINIILNQLFKLFEFIFVLWFDWYFIFDYLFPLLTWYFTTLIFCPQGNALHWHTTRFVHFHLQPQYKYEWFHINFTSFHCTGRYELKKLTSLPMCGFIAKWEEHRTGIAEVTGSNPVLQASSFQLLNLENLLPMITLLRDHTCVLVIRLELVLTEKTFANTMKLSLMMCFSTAICYGFSLDTMGEIACCW